MRIIAGQNRGLRLAEIGKGDPAAHLRPTTDRVRESLFNVLRNWIDFQELRVLDLFAGTGALGLEALSRGAACHFRGERPCWAKADWRKYRKNARPRPL